MIIRDIYSFRKKCRITFLYHIYYTAFLYTVGCFIDVSATNKIINLTWCVILHDNLTYVDYYETH